ncbi:MAG: tRNA threonylcarbamoyladenosine dehydratase [Clostridia bacterium]|nr:tRNA threonylcarbamoyladenosine dehydratase [Clostridia bacterium]
MDFLARSLPLLGKEGLATLKKSRVLVLGLGGVGAACAEALVRGGVGSLVFADGDAYSPTNKNRQLYATDETLGKNKALVAAHRAKEINPEITVEAREVYFKAGEDFDLDGFDYICDCIDDVDAKLDLICRACEQKIPIISAMGAGGKLDPTRFRVADIAKTHTCPLAKKMRVELRRRGITHTKVVFSDEISRAVTSPPASVSFVPPVMGFLMAAEVVRTLCETTETEEE